MTPLEKHPTRLREPDNLAAIESSLTPARLVSRTPKGALSPFQIDTVSRVFASLSSIGSFLLADGTGVGKGRVLAACAAEAHARGASAAWVSSSLRLRREAGEELSAVEHAASDVWFGSYTCLLHPAHADALVDAATKRLFTLLMLDECHALRSRRSVLAALHRVVQRIRDQGTHVAVVYSSATPLSAVDHVPYLTFLAPWRVLGFDDPIDLQRCLMQCGETGMEMLAMCLKARGAYLRRTIAMDDVRVSFEQIRLSGAQRRLYDACCARLHSSSDGITRQLFFQRLISCFKTARAIEIAQHAVRDGFAVVIAVQTTGASTDARAHASDHSDARCDGGGFRSSCLDAFVRAGGDATGLTLPLTPLDEIVRTIGPDEVAEVSGRQARHVVAPDGRVVYQPRPTSKSECCAFQEGRKRVAVITRAGASGISLHARGPNDRPRVHITLETPWSCEDFVQQCGRSHRTGTGPPPRYVVLHTDVAAEKRFVHDMARKLARMGAFAEADRTGCSAFVRADEHAVVSAASRREVAICIAYAAVRARHAHTTLPSLAWAPRTDVKVSTARTARDLLHRLEVAATTDESAEDDAVAARTAAEDARTMYGAIINAWEPVASEMSRPTSDIDTDDGFARLVKEAGLIAHRRACTVLLAARRPECSRTLGLLDPAIMMMILRLVLGADTARALRTRGADLFHVLCDTGLTPRALPSATNIFVLNRCLCMRTDDQHLLIAALDRSAQRVHTRRGVYTVEDYVLRHAKNPKLIDIDVRVSTNREGEHVVSASARPVQRVQEGTLPMTTEYARSAVTGEICAAVPDAARALRHLRRPGRADAFDTLSEAEWVQRRDRGDFSLVAQGAWDAAANAAWVRLERTCAALVQTLVLSPNGLTKWETSKKVVLRVGGTPLFGLLLTTSRRRRS